MNKILYQITFILGLFLIVGMLSNVANASDINLQLSMVAYTDLDASPELTQHLEYGNILYDGQIIGNYRMSGICYDDPTPPDNSIKSGDCYFEVYGMGYLFLKIMTNSSTPDYFEGIITGGTGSLTGMKGTVSGEIWKQVGMPVPIILHLM